MNQEEEFGVGAGHYDGRGPEPDCLAAVTTNKRGTFSEDPMLLDPNMLMRYFLSYNSRPNAFVHVQGVL